MIMIKVGSLFAGVGGMCKGFEIAGASLSWANEIDKYACVTYRANFSHRLIEGNITSIDPRGLGSVDIITSGFPCQPFSVAGNREGFSDRRGDGFFETMRIVRAVAPKAILLENVKGLVGHNNGETFSEIIATLRSSGYIPLWIVANSRDYGNVPQSRERVYIVAFANASAADRFSWPSKIELATGIKDIIDRDAPVKYFLSESSPSYDLARSAITKTGTVYQIRRVYVRENKSGVCPTLTANMGTGGNNVPLVLADRGIRKLTPRECFSLQGFGHDFCLPAIADCHLYKQAGNAVTVTVVARIARSIIDAM
jgi:DNA (cytosine-5)-methyltransferase 1